MVNNKMLKQIPLVPGVTNYNQYLLNLSLGPDWVQVRQILSNHLKLFRVVKNSGSQN